jgi:hypothetical protein
LVDCECQTFKENRVFITRATFSGNLGGLGGADAKCQQSADAAKLGGRWKAFVSGNGVAAADRFVTDGPWFENGSHALVFANRAAMRKGPAINVNRDEFEADDKVSMYWTGTQVSGAPAANCGSWNSSASAEKGTQGQVNTVLPAWVAAGDYACNTTASLLCLEE